MFNLGEKRTPTIGERLAYLTRRDASELMGGEYDFHQNLHFDTTKIRDLLGYEDVVDEIDAMNALA